MGMEPFEHHRVRQPAGAARVSSVDCTHAPETSNMRTSKLGRRSAASLLLTLSALVMACGDDDAPALDADSTLARDLTLATPELSVPELQDSALRAPPPSRSPNPGRTPAPRPAAPSPRPTPAPSTSTVSAPVETPSAPTPAPAPVPSPASRAMISAGTAMTLSVGSRVCTSNRVGDKFVATLNESVVGSNGAMIPAGTRAVVEVASITPGGNGTDPRIVFRVRTMSTDHGPVAPVGEAIPQDSLEQVRIEGGSDAKKVAAGAIAGAIIGQMIGKDTRGTVIGAATGAAAGTVAARAGAKYDGCLPQGGDVRLVLAEGLIIG